MAVKRGVHVAPFDAFAEPGALVELARAAEDAGWDGVFLWDHVAYRPPVRGLADPWVALAAMACATERVRLGPLVTPLSRRRVQKVARETVTLDRLSGGRLTFGVGLGSDRNGELEPFGEVVNPRERARLLDEGLTRLAGFWAGEFEPQPLQRPRIPVWVAGRWPRRLPLRRAARWDGLFPIELPNPDALAQMVAELRYLRASDAGPFDVVVDLDPGEASDPWEAAGATWTLTSFGARPEPDEVRKVIEAGP